MYWSQDKLQPVAKEEWATEEEPDTITRDPLAPLTPTWRCGGACASSFSSSFPNTWGRGFRASGSTNAAKGGGYCPPMNLLSRTLPRASALSSSSMGGSALEKTGRSNPFGSAMVVDAPAQRMRGRGAGGREVEASK